MKQINLISIELLHCKKHWSEKKKHAIGIIKSFYHGITEDQLQWFIEVYTPSEDKRLRRKYMAESKSGIRNTKFTPTDVDGTFEVVTSPTIGFRYHVSWASKGAVFVLKKIDGEYGYLDNPKHKRASLLKVKLSELRKIR